MFGKHIDLNPFYNGLIKKDVGWRNTYFRIFCYNCNYISEKSLDIIVATKITAFNYNHTNDHQ